MYAFGYACNTMLCESAAGRGIVRDPLRADEGQIVVDSLVCLLCAHLVSIGQHLDKLPSGLYELHSDLRHE